MRKALAVLLVLWIASTSWAADAPPLRVVALGGDITETVYAIGAQQDLVGVDSTSEWPAEAKKLPDVGYVRQLNTEGILALRPGLIIATHDAGPPPVMAQLHDAGISMVLLPPSRSPDDVIAKVQTVAHVLNRDAQAQRVIEHLSQTYALLKQHVAAMPQHPRVIFLLSAGSDNLLAAGQETAADHAIALAGGRNVITAYSGYKPLSPEALVAAAPDAVIVMTERSDGVGDIAKVMALPGIAQTPAGMHRHILFVDGQALLGFGPRNAESELALQRALAALALP